MSPYYVPPAPYVIATDPPNNSVDVPVDHPVSIAFSEDINWGVDQWSKTSVSYDDTAMNHVFPAGIRLQNGSRLGGVVLREGRWPNVMWYYADVETPWPAGSTILINIEPGAVYVQDWHNRSKDNQQPANFPDVKNVQGYTLRFTTATGLVPTGMVYPNNDSSKVPLDPEIKVLFNHDIVRGRLIADYDFYANITLRPVTDAVLDKSGKRINPTATPVPILKAIEGNRLAIRPNNTVLTPYKNYEITLPGGSLMAADDKDIWLPWTLTIPFATVKTGDSGLKDLAGGTDNSGGNVSPAGAGPMGSSQTSPLIFGVGAVLALVAVGCLKRR